MRLAVFFDYFFRCSDMFMPEVVFLRSRKKREGPTDDYESLSYYELNFQFFFFFKLLMKKEIIQPINYSDIK